MPSASFEVWLVFEKQEVLIADGDQGMDGCDLDLRYGFERKRCETG
jgi:hypothetical protein